MDSAALEFFSPLLDSVDHWSEFAALLPVIALLELILSADNAVALASITKKLNDTELQRKSLDIGIAIALFLRIILILTANIIIKYSFIQLLAALYLFYIVISKFFLDKLTSSDNQSSISESKSNISFFTVTASLALTDLAFSVDSVTAAVAISDQLILVLLGSLIGVLALRFTADLFINWLDIYQNLEIAGYLAVALVAFKLIFAVIFSNIYVPDYIFYVLLLVIFVWGFLNKKK